MKISSVVFAFLICALLRGKNNIFCCVTKFVEKNEFGAEKCVGICGDVKRFIDDVLIFMEASLG